ncbi:MAG: uroporphyrinogen decarboxylase [Chloroflexi bacterium]|nr:uroporphyrinogen decarboxylase [Chloroflexota bacterium]
MTSRLLQACRREPVDRTPVWFMRQAGRVLPEYRAIRERHDLVSISQQPELCAEVTLQPVRRFGVDAAILFADIMTPLIAIGLDLRIVEREGPVLGTPIRCAADLERLRPLEPEEDVPYVMEAIRLVRQQLPAELPLICFAGGPFTLASYLIEGRASRTFERTKQLMYCQPAVWASLMERLAAMVRVYLQAQVAAGADVVQLFDSWVGCLSPDDYRTYVQPYSRSIFEGLRDAPTIHFGTDTGSLLTAMAEAGGDVIGVDWRVPLDVAWQRIGHERAVQGNLDPLTLLGPWEVVRDSAQRVLEQAEGRPGHIFNLGHGLHPQTPVENVVRLVELVHGERR